ncbi:MAG: hypothetical protein M5U08_02565 [Burkholderiales bacterium]|nr:hypothetical protein [Burkholderiales bacterium]
MVDATALESIPPLSAVPIGTSERIRIRHASMNSARNCSTCSSYRAGAATSASSVFQWRLSASLPPAKIPECPAGKRLIPSTRHLSVDS